MFAIRCKRLAAYFIAALHCLALSSVVHFDIHWFDDRRPPAATSAIAISLLVCLGADLALLGFWLAFSSTRCWSRVAAVAVSIVCWMGIYDQSLYSSLRHWRYYYDESGWEYYIYGRCAATGGLALLVISTLACALLSVMRRGVKLRQLEPDELHRERSKRQFKVSHLLLLVTVLSLVLAFATNSRDWLSRPVSLRWYFAGYAPIQSAETVLYSAFTLCTVSLTVAWATLGYGRPWLKLIMALTAAAFLGFAWAYSFTSTQHQKFLFGHVLFSMVVALLQAVVISVVLMSVRIRGYRLVKSIA